MYRFFQALLVTSALFLGALPQVKAQTNQRTSIAMEDFLQAAAFNGLVQDALSKTLVKRLLAEGDLWVGKCPICDEIRRGFDRYLAFDQPGVNTKLNPQLLSGLESTDADARKAVLKVLIDGYIQQHYTTTGMSPQERKSMESQLMEARKVGMQRAGAADREGFYCASCDGACHQPMSDEMSWMPPSNTATDVEVFTSLEEVQTTKSQVLALDLSNQDLSEVPGEVFGLENLKSLNLSNNQLKSISPDIALLQQLEELDLSHNSTHHRILYSIVELKNLKKLNLSHNQIQQIPAVIEELTELEELQLKGLRLNDHQKMVVQQLLPGCTIIFE